MDHQLSIAGADDHNNNTTNNNHHTQKTTKCAVSDEKARKTGRPHHPPRLYLASRFILWFRKGTGEGDRRVPADPTHHIRSWTYSFSCRTFQVNLNATPVQDTPTTKEFLARRVHVRPEAKLTLAESSRRRFETKSLVTGTPQARASRNF